MKTSNEIGKLATALATAQRDIKPATMNKVNPFLKKTYADLNSIVDAIRDVLAENGLSYVQMPSTPPADYGPAVSLTTRLMHTSGEWLEDTFVMPMPTNEAGKSIMQVAGSGISYARRYALAAMLGVVADEDSDGAGPQKKPTAGTNGAEVQPEPPNDEQVIFKSAKQFITTAVRTIDRYNHSKGIKNAMKLLGYDGVPGGADDGETRVTMYQTLVAYASNRDAGMTQEKAISGARSQVHNSK